MSNPYKSSDVMGQPMSIVAGGNQRVRLRRVGVLSLGVFMGAGGVLVGLMVGVFFFFVMALGVGFGAAAGGGPGVPGGGGAAPAAVAAGMGFAFLLFAPVFYGVLGFIGGLIYGLIFNLVASMSGGLEIELSN